MTFTRIVEFTPAYDRRSSDPKQNYGVGSVQLRLVLKGSRGAVQFLLYTDWHLPHVVQELDHKGYRFAPSPADLGYHSLVPRYEGQEPITDACPYLDGQPCYYDGSSLAADAVWLRLLNDGDAGVWAALEDYYRHVFGDEPHLPCTGYVQP